MIDFKVDGVKEKWMEEVEEVEFHTGYHEWKRSLQGLASSDLVGLSARTNECGSRVEQSQYRKMASDCRVNFLAFSLAAMYRAKRNNEFGKEIFKQRSTVPVLDSRYTPSGIQKRSSKQRHAYEPSYSLSPLQL